MSDIADRLRAQTQQYTEQNLRQKLTEAEAVRQENTKVIERLTTALAVAVQHTKEANEMADALIHFVVNNVDEGPAWLIELVANRMEDKLTPKVEGEAKRALDGIGAGAILRCVGGKLVWEKP